MDLAPIRASVPAAPSDCRGHRVTLCNRFPEPLGLTLVEIRIGKKLRRPAHRLLWEISRHFRESGINKYDATIHPGHIRDGYAGIHGIHRRCKLCVGPRELARV